jgi:hypothetical protein
MILLQVLAILESHDHARFFDFHVNDSGLAVSVC